MKKKRKKVKRELTYRDITVCSTVNGVAAMSTEVGMYDQNRINRKWFLSLVVVHCHKCDGCF